METDNGYSDNIQNIRIYLKDKNEKLIKKYSKYQNLGYSVLSLSVVGNLNTGAMIRTAQLLGAEKFIIFGIRKYDRRSSVGAQKYMQVDRVHGLKNSCNELKDYVSKEDREICPEKLYNYLVENKLVPIFLEQSSRAIFDDEINWNYQHLQLNDDNKFCFIFGNEADGITKDIIDKCLEINGSFIITIRQLGVLQSFNVSISSAIILSKYRDWKVKQRIGCYL